jgi:hypothetical protein
MACGGNMSYSNAHTILWRALIALLTAPAPAFAAATSECSEYGLLSNETGWCVPEIKLDPKLARIFSMPAAKCQAISGLTCKVKYNGETPLPSEVFFVELDARGNVLTKPVRLIYPHLKKGETGTATLRTARADATAIMLTGKWEGPWKNPY